jgi:class 3 adenylate cyclase/tetratricopeptide (TPR) repeat protein
MGSEDQSTPTPGSADAAARTELDRLAGELFERPPAEAETILGKLLAAGTPAEVRAQALGMLALRQAHAGSPAGLAAAQDSVDRAAALEPQGADTLARLAHARGYLAFKLGTRTTALFELNRAAELYGSHPRRAQVVDTLGMLFRDLYGDVARARAYFERSYELKKGQSEAAGHDWIGLAITCGNLGQLELACERFDAAERWLREDLEVVLGHVREPFAEAIARVLLGEALLGQGSARRDEARTELDRALAVAPGGSQPRAEALVARARVALADDDEPTARQHLREARSLAERHGFVAVLGTVRLAEGVLHRRKAARPADDDALAAARAFAEARRGFRALDLHPRAIEAAVAEADLSRQLGKDQEALRKLLDVALPEAERHLFGQLQPLERIEARIAEIDPWQALRVKQRRTLGGVPEEDQGGRLHGERRRLTVWTCDIRGFTRYCDQTDPDRVVEMLNRFFASIGQPIVDAGGCIDKYVGDNVLGYLANAEQAAGIALAALGRVAELNAQCRHLDEPEIAIGIGIATGEVIVGNIGFARKLEHTIIGTPVNRACRLVGEAGAGEILVDRATSDAIRGAFHCEPAATLHLKGLGEVPTFRLRGRAERSLASPTATRD